MSESEPVKIDSRNVNLIQAFDDYVITGDQNDLTIFELELAHRERVDYIFK